MDEIRSWLNEIIAFLVGGAAGFTLKTVIIRLKASGRSNVMHQSGSGTQQNANKAGGDIAGRDIKK